MDDKEIFFDATESSKEEICGSDPVANPQADKEQEGMVGDTSARNSNDNSLALMPLPTVKEIIVTGNDGKSSINISNSHYIANVEGQVNENSAYIEYKLSIPELRSPENISGRTLTRKSGYQVLRSQGSSNIAPGNVRITGEQRISPTIGRRSLIPTAKPRSGKSRSNNEHHDSGGHDSCREVDATHILAQVESPSESMTSPAEEKLDSAVRRSTKYGTGPTIRVSANADEVIMGTGHSATLSDMNIIEDTPTRRRRHLRIPSSSRLTRSGSTRKSMHGKTATTLPVNAHETTNRFGLRTAGSAAQTNIGLSTTHYKPRKSSLPSSPGYIPFRTGVSATPSNHVGVPASASQSVTLITIPHSPDDDSMRSDSTESGRTKSDTVRTAMTQNTVNMHKLHQPENEVMKKPKQTFKNRVSAILSSRRSLPSLQRAPTAKAVKVEMINNTVLRPTSNILLGSKRWLSPREIRLSESSNAPKSAKNHSELENTLTNKQKVDGENTGMDSKARGPLKLGADRKGIPVVQVASRNKKSSPEKQSRETDPSELTGANSLPRLGLQSEQQKGTLPQDEIDRAIRESKENFDLILARMPLVSDARMRRTLEDVLIPLAAAIEATIVARNAGIRLDGAIADLTILTAQMGAKAGQLAVHLR